MIQPDQKPLNPNRRQSIQAMLVAGVVTLILVVVYLAQLGGDDTQTAIGKALVVVPSLLIILCSFFAAYYYRYFLRIHILKIIAISFEPEETEETEETLGILNMLQKVKELQAELDATKTNLRTFEAAWDELFGPISLDEVKIALSRMYDELETLRESESTGKITTLEQEAKNLTLAAQETEEELRESKNKVTQLTQHNEELLKRVNQAVLRIELLESEKEKLQMNAKQYTWIEVNWEEFLATVNFGQDLLTENRWGERIRQRIRKEGLILFGDPTITSLVSNDNK